MVGFSCSFDARYPAETAWLVVKEINPGQAVQTDEQLTGKSYVYVPVALSLSADSNQSGSKRLYRLSGVRPIFVPP